MLLTPVEEASFKQFAQTIRPLQEFIEDPTVSEIMVNNPKSIWVEKSGRMMQVDITLNSHQLNAGIKYLASGVGNKDATPGTPTGIVNAAHQNMRIAAVMFPTAIDGDALCIRKHSKRTFGAKDYIERGAFDRKKVRALKSKILDDIDLNEPLENERLMEFINQEIGNKKNFLISGGTNAGKTSLLNMFLTFIPHDQRVITIEDTEELKVAVPNMVRLISNRSKGVTAQMLVELCLRFKPDRIVCGEVRGSEALDFVQALNTGHDGGFASLHAKNAHKTLSRLETLAKRGIENGGDSGDSLQIEIADTIDYVIHFKKDSLSDARYLNEMVRVEGVTKGKFEVSTIFD